MLQRDWYQTLIVPVMIVLVVAAAVLSIYVIGSASNLLSTIGVRLPAISDQSSVAVPPVADATTITDYLAWDEQAIGLADSWLSYQNLEDWFDYTAANAVPTSTPTNRERLGM